MLEPSPRVTVISLFFMFNDLTLEEITFFIDYFSLHFHLRNFTVLVISVLKSTNQYTGKYINIYMILFRFITVHIGKTGSIEGDIMQEYFYMTY